MSNKLINTIAGIAYIIIAVILWINPLETSLLYIKYIGIVYLINTAVNYLYLKKNNFYIPTNKLMLSALIGVLIALMPVLPLTIVAWIFIAMFLFISITYLSIQMKYRQGVTIQLIMGFLAVAFGFMMVFNPLIAISMITKIIGLVIFLNGISYLSIAPYR